MPGSDNGDNASGAGGRRAVQPLELDDVWDRAAAPSSSSELDRNDMMPDHEPELDFDADEFASAATYNISPEAKRRAWWREAIINLLYIAAWFSFATLLSMYNKWMFSPNYFNFPFPLFVTTTHMAVQFSLAFGIRSLWPHLFNPPGRPTVKEYVQKCMPCGVATGLDIGLSNLSLKTITLSLYTMCKSSSLIFVLTFAFIFRLERFSLRLVSVILLITVGVLMMVLSTDVSGHGPTPPAVEDPVDSSIKSTATAIVARSLPYAVALLPRAIPAKFKTPAAIGVILVLSASALGGLRWALTQVLLSGAGHHHPTKTRHNREHRKTMGLNHPAATIFYLTPTMFFSLLIVAYFLEGPFPRTLSESGFFDSFEGSVRTVSYVLFPGALAFAMVMSEYTIIQRTGIVPMSIAGIFKEVTTILLSTWFFGDSMTLVNWIGLLITFGGIVVFTHHKYQKSVYNASEGSDDDMADAQLLMGSRLSNGHAAVSANGDIALPPYSSVASRSDNGNIHGDSDEDDDDEEEDNRILGSESRRSLLFDASDVFGSSNDNGVGSSGAVGRIGNGQPRGGLPPLRLNIASTPSPFSSLRKPPPEPESPPRKMMNDFPEGSLMDTPSPPGKKKRDSRRVRFDVEDDDDEDTSKSKGPASRVRTGKVLDL
ncbi:Triose-phosphate Transporter [Tulasnella sp. JGI-2019a]|nr:Triose-phosphate Transporter [Tulasnella sp. JGI-2019a]